MSDNRKIELVVLLIGGGVAFLVLAFPMILDFWYGSGRLDQFFISSELWVSFIGSYYPSTIIGILTLYQAYIIHYQERKRTELLQPYQFQPDGHANLCAYNETNDKIGDYSLKQMRQLFAIDNENKSLFEESMAGYVLECNIFTLLGVGIYSVELEKIEWRINNNTYIHNDVKSMASIVNRTGHNKQQIISYWELEKESSENDQIIQCLLFNIREDIRYATSKITLFFKVLDDIGKQYNLQMHFRLSAYENEYMMVSIEEHCYSARGK